MVIIATDECRCLASPATIGVVWRRHLQSQKLYFVVDEQICLKLSPTKVNALPVYSLKSEGHWCMWDRGPYRGRCTAGQKRIDFDECLWCRRSRCAETFQGCLSWLNIHKTQGAAEYNGRLYMLQVIFEIKDVWHCTACSVFCRFSASWPLSCCVMVVWCMCPIHWTSSYGRDAVRLLLVTVTGAVTCDTKVCTGTDVVPLRVVNCVPSSQTNLVPRSRCVCPMLDE